MLVLLNIGSSKVRLLGNPDPFFSLRAKNWRLKCVAILNFYRIELQSNSTRSQSGEVKFSFSYSFVADDIPVVIQISFNSPMLVLETAPRLHGIFILGSNDFMFLEFPRDLLHMFHLSQRRHLLPFSLFVIFFPALMLLLVQMMRMVAFHVSFKIGVLSESLSTFRARESVFVLVREMNHLGGEINYTYQN